MEITLDGQMIFKGEITRACGGVIGGCELFGDVSIVVGDSRGMVVNVGFSL